MADSIEQNVTIRVANVNDAPTPTFTSFTAQENRRKRGVLSATDDDNDTLTFSVVDKPEHGEFYLEKNGSFAYTPYSTFIGNDSFTYKVNDGTVYSAVQNVTIRVIRINSAPTPLLKSLDVTEDITRREILRSEDIDENDTLTFKIVKQPLHGTLNLEANGSFTYTPNHNFNGSDSFTYKVNDGIVDSVEQRVAITVNNVNDAPTPTFATLRVQEDTTKIATLTATDIDSNSSSFVFRVITQPQHATLNLDRNGSFSYTPNHNFIGNDSFTYRVSDSLDNSREQRVVVTVGNTNDAPQIVTNFQNITIDKNSTVKLSINISDLDGDSLTLNIESNSSILTINKNFTNPILQATYADINKPLYFDIISDDKIIGRARVTITLSDGDINVSKSFDVNITNVFNSNNEIRWRGLVYKEVTSPKTGRVWLDRNLGAKRVCQDANDADCFGDYYQWGREADGHEKNNSLTTTDKAQSPTDPNTKGKFITIEYQDWADFDINGSIRSANWLKTDGSSICPVGFRVPTADEYVAEKVGSDATVANNLINGFLKMSYADSRSSLGVFYSNDGLMWTASYDTDINSLNYLSHRSARLAIDYMLVDYGVPRTLGYPVRCIKAN